VWAQGQFAAVQVQETTQWKEAGAAAVKAEVVHAANLQWPGEAMMLLVEAAGVLEQVMMALLTTTQAAMAPGMVVSKMTVAHGAAVAAEEDGAIKGRPWARIKVGARP